MGENTVELILAIICVLAILISSALGCEWLGALFGLVYVITDMIGIALSD